MSTGARTGTLPEGQVQAMFDRIAGVYDVMNSRMTAGLHHQWRTRAGDLAELRPGERALEGARERGEGARARGACGRRGRRLALLGGHARARPPQGPRPALRMGRRAPP